MLKQPLKKIAGNYYIIIGKNIEGNPGEETEHLFNGNAEIIDDMISINLSSAGYQTDDRHGFLGTLELELDNDLYGTLRGLEMNATPDGISPEVFKVQSASDKYLILVPCDSIED